MRCHDLYKSINCWRDESAMTWRHKAGGRLPDVQGCGCPSSGHFNTHFTSSLVFITLQSCLVTANRRMVFAAILRQVLAQLFASSQFWPFHSVLWSLLSNCCRSFSVVYWWAQIGMFLGWASALWWLRLKKSEGMCIDVFLIDWTSFVLFF